MADNPEYRIHLRAVAELRAADVRFFHTPNESNSPPQYRAKLKRMGLSKGVPDLIIPAPTTGGAPGAVLELKSPRGRLSPEQRSWLAHWSSIGWAAAWTRGHAVTAGQLVVWGYITPEAADTWVHWAHRTDTEAL